MKRRFCEGTKQQQHKWKRELHWKSVVYEIQRFLPVKDVAAIVAGYAVEPQHVLRFVKTKKELVDVLTDQVVYKWGGGVGYNAKTLWIRELDGVFVAFGRNISFVSMTDGTQRSVSSFAKGYQIKDLAYHVPTQSLVVSALNNHKVMILKALRKSTWEQTQLVRIAVKERQQMVLLNGNVVIITGNDKDDFITPPELAGTATVNIWSADLKSKLLTDKIIITHNWPLILKNEIICSSSPDHFDTIYKFMENGVVNLISGEIDHITGAQYSVSSGHVYKIHKNLVCELMKFKDQDLNDDVTIHSVQRTECGVFLIGSFQRSISLEFSYRCYREYWNGGFYKVEDKQELVEGITHCLVLN